MSNLLKDNEEIELDKPAAEKRRWFTTNMAQLMVFLNGLIMTATAFAVLNVFIQQTIVDSLERAAEETETYVTKEVSGLEDALYSISSVIDLSQDLSPERLLSVVNDGPFPLERFDQILWMEQIETDSWRIRSLLDAPLNKLFYDSFILHPSKPFVDYILSIKSDDDKLQMVTQVKGTRSAVLGDRTIGREQPFILMRSMTSQSGMQGILIGFARISPALSQDWMEKRSFLQNVILSDQETEIPIYVYGKSLIESDQSKNLVTYNFIMDFAYRELSVQIDITKGEKEAFLENIPMLMLLFGVTLTLIGTMYVRNNQKQSYKLTLMNTELAQNNDKLNSEVEERERLNSVIRKAERENRAIIDSVSDIIFEATAEGELLFVNETWEKVTGFEKEYSLGRSLFDMLHPQDQEDQRKSFDMLVKGRQQAYRVFTRLRTSNGTFHAVELAVSMLRQDENKNLRVVGTITDVEERRRAERALGEAEKKYRTIVENAAGGIYQVTPEGHFLSANPAMAEIFGYDSQEEMLRRIRNANEEVFADTEKRRGFLRELEEKGLIRNHESMAYCKDGSEIWVSENARAVLDEDDNLLYFEGSVEDITERKNSESVLREAKLQSDLANRAKSEFLANMSHELRTPLNSIIGFSEILKSEALGPIGDKSYLEYSHEIYDSGKRLLNIINEILDVSRVEVGERQLNEGVVDINRAVAACLELMDPKIQNNCMQVHNKIDENTPKIVGEELAVKQMIMNLISNAVKFTQSGGAITVESEIDSENGEFHLSVSDTGIGLDQDQIQKALSPFGQLNSEFNRSGSGAGLGLTLVNSLMQLHGGRFDIISQKGVGTTATLIFPAQRVSQKDKADEYVPTPDQEGEERIGEDA